MNRIPIEVGRVVMSRVGRDQGRLMMVVGMADEAHVLLADGDLRKLAKPKKKKIMHISPTPACFASIREKLNAGLCVQDAQIRKALIEAEPHNQNKPCEEG